MILTDAKPVTQKVENAHAELSRLTHLALLNRGIFPAERCMFVTSTAMQEADIEVRLFRNSLYFPTCQTK